MPIPPSPAHRTEQRFAGGVNTDLGLYAEDDWVLGRVTLTGGVRADRYTIRNGYYRTADDAGTVTGSTTYPNRSDWEFSWRGGAVLQVAENLKLRGAAYSGLRLPTLNELYRPFVVFPVVTMANENLTPEKLEGWDVGFDWRPLPGVQLTATAFDNKLKDAITNVTIGTNLRQRRNIDAIDASGVELDAALRFGAFGFDGSLAYTEAKQRGSGFAAALDGYRPSQTPRWAASATASWRPAAGTKVALTLRHVGRQFEDDQQTDVLPAATTLDAFAAGSAPRRAELRRAGRKPVRCEDHHPQPGRIDGSRYAAHGLGRLPLRVLGTAAKTRAALWRPLGSRHRQSRSVAGLAATVLLFGLATPL